MIAEPYIPQLPASCIVRSYPSGELCGTVYETADHQRWRSSYSGSDVYRVDSMNAVIHGYVGGGYIFGW